MERVKVYIDGLNLYHGIRAKYGHKYLWLDLEALARRLLREDQSLVCIDYFTARVRGQPESEQRQATYLDSLSAHCPNVHVIEGRFQAKKRRCRSCGKTWDEFEEKETDVSIAAALIEDAVNDIFDVALLITADSDLCPAVRTVRRICPTKRVLAAFPPGRNSDSLRRELGGAAFQVGHANIRQSLLPETVVNDRGISFDRPPFWK